MHDGVVAPLMGVHFDRERFDLNTDGRVLLQRSVHTNVEDPLAITFDAASPSPRRRLRQCRMQSA